MATAPPPLHLYEPAQAHREAACLSQRRAEVALLPIDSGSGDDQRVLAAVCAAKGLALSGGGIRSATFNLGV